jgi:hypothetical protein
MVPYNGYFTITGCAILTRLGKYSQWLTRGLIMKTAFLGALGCVLSTLLLSGCATVFEGTSQEVSVVTNPAGASCAFERQGMEVGRIESTPGTANIRKSKYDLTIKCDKPGFAEATYLNHSGTTATIAANVAADLLLTGGLSSIVDSADGADNKYDSAVNLNLTPLYAEAAEPVLPSGTVIAAATQPVAQSMGMRPCTREDMEMARYAQANGFRYKLECR